MNKKIAGLVVGAVAVLVLPVLSLAGGSFFIDDTTSYVGIGNTTPASRLDVAGAMYSRMVVASSSAINWNAGNVQSMTLSSSPTLTFSNGQAGGIYKLILNQDGAGNRTVTWPASVLWSNNTAPTLSTGAHAIDIANFVYDGTHYLGSFDGNIGGSMPSSLANSLVAYWNFEGNSNDATSTNNGTDSNIGYGSSDGRLGDGAHFSSASSSLISLADTSDLKPTGSFSVNVWFKSTTNTGGGFLQAMSSDPNVAGFNVGFGNPSATFSIGTNTGTTQDTDYKFIWGQANSVIDGSWHMVTAIYDGSDMYLYQDGTLVDSASWSGIAYDTTTYIRIGTYNAAGTDQNFWDGSMDELGLWERALSPTEVADLYNSGSGKTYPF
jgi:hypothetical protein